MSKKMQLNNRLGKERPMGKKCVTKNFESLLWVYVLVEAIVSVPFLLFGIAFPFKLFSLPKCFSSFSMFCLQIYVSQKNDFQTVIILILVIAFLHIFVKILFSRYNASAFSVSKFAIIPSTVLEEKDISLFK